MKPRRRSAVLLLITLFIGMILGALLQSSLRAHRMKQAGFMRTEATFIENIVRAIDPVDEAQAAAVHAILESSASDLFVELRKSRKLVRNEIEVMKEALIPLLNEEQQERLKSQVRPIRKKALKKKKGE